MIPFIRRFIREEDGAAAVEYALLLSLIILTCLGTIGALGQGSNATFTEISTSL